MKHARISLALLLFACGPSVSVEDDGTTGDNGTAGGPGTSNGTAPNPTTSPPTSTSNPTTTTNADSTTTDDPTEDPDAGGLMGPQLDLPHDCDVWLDDCPRGSKCMPWANDGSSTWNATKCTPLARDPHQVGEPCTVEGNGVSGVDDCEARAMCWNVDPDTNMGECAAFCEGSEAEPTCVDACSECHIPGNGLIILCLPICDPLVQDCPQEQGCYAIDDTFACAPDASKGGGQQGDHCEFINVCAPGLFCADADTMPDCTLTTGCCTTFCDVAAADPCPPGLACIPSDAAPLCGSAEVGVCLLPD
jgi:hypothetical protein